LRLAPNGYIANMIIVKITFHYVSLVALLLLASCSSLSNSESAILIQSVSNPGKTKKAILFLNEGNATVGKSLQLSIKDDHDNLDEMEVGNTFIVDDDHGKAVLKATAIKFWWKDDRHLVINYDKRLRTFIKNDHLGNIVIAYNCF
jgi:hypothetical protein